MVQRLSQEEIDARMRAQGWKPPQAQASNPDPNDPANVLREEEIKTQREAIIADRDRQRRIREQERASYEREQVAAAEARASTAEGVVATARVEEKKRGNEMVEEEIRERQLAQARQREDLIQEVMTKHGVGHAQAERIVDGPIGPPVASPPSSGSSVVVNELEKALGEALAGPIKEGISRMFQASDLTEARVLEIIKANNQIIVDAIRGENDPKKVVADLEAIVGLGEHIKDRFGGGKEDTGPRITGSDSLRLEERRMDLEDKRESLKIKKEHALEQQKLTIEEKKAAGMKEIGEGLIAIATGIGGNLIKKKGEGGSKGETGKDNPKPGSDIKAAPVTIITCPECKTEYEVLATATHHYCETCKKVLVLGEQEE